MEKPFRFEWDYEEFSVRTTTSMYGRTYVELVKWYEGENGKRYCYTIAYWTHSKEGWDLRFVGDRMLEVSQLHIEKIWPQLCAAQIMFEAWLKDQEDDV